MTDADVKEDNLTQAVEGGRTIIHYSGSLAGVCGFSSFDVHIFFSSARFKSSLPTCVDLITQFY